MAPSSRMIPRRPSLLATLALAFGHVVSRASVAGADPAGEDALRALEARLRSLEDWRKSVADILVVDAALSTETGVNSLLLRRGGGGAILVPLQETAAAAAQLDALAEAQTSAKRAVEAAGRCFSDAAVVDAAADGSAQAAQESTRRPAKAEAAFASPTLELRRFSGSSPVRLRFPVATVECTCDANQSQPKATSPVLPVSPQSPTQEKTVSVGLTYMPLLRPRGPTSSPLCLGEKAQAWEAVRQSMTFALVKSDPNMPATESFSLILGRAAELVGAPSAGGQAGDGFDTYFSQDCMIGAVCLSLLARLEDFAGAPDAGMPKAAGLSDLSVAIEQVDPRTMTVLESQWYDLLAAGWPIFLLLDRLRTLAARQPGAAGHVPAQGTVEEKYLGAIQDSFRNNQLGSLPGLGASFLRGGSVFQNQNSDGSDRGVDAMPALCALASQLLGPELQNPSGPGREAREALSHVRAFFRQGVKTRDDLAGTITSVWPFWSIMHTASLHLMSDGAG